MLDNQGQYSSRWQAIMSISAKIGCSAHTLNEWVKKAEVDSGKRAGVPTDVADKMKALKRENRELLQLSCSIGADVRQSWMPLQSACL